MCLDMVALLSQRWTCGKHPRCHGNANALGVVNTCTGVVNTCTGKHLHWLLIFFINLQLFI